MGAKHTVQKIEVENLSKGLKNRHIQMIAIGGAIGVGLFYGAAGAIHLAGPSILLAYAVVGIAIFFIMRALGEMAVEEPVSGSFVSYASRYITPFAGFFLAWNYLLQIAAASAAEYNAVGQYIQFWIPGFPIWITSAIIVCFVTIINVVAVRAYGEIEYILSFIKVIAIIGMIILGGAMILFGIGNAGHAVGFSNLVKNGGFFATGIKGWILSFVLVVFSFGGVQSVGITAGEARDVKKTIPKAINSIFWRILIFYIGAIGVMISLYDWKDIGTNGSPFVTVFSMMGIPAAASIINLVVIAAGISSMNSGIYAVTRVLYNRALQGQAPAILAKVNKSKAPFVALILTVLTQIVGIIANYLIPASAFAIFSSILVFGMIVMWMTILFSELKFRRIRIKNGEEDKISFKMPFWPYSSYFAISFMFFIVVVMWFLPSTRVALYVGPIWMGILFILYKFTVSKRKIAPQNQEDLSQTKDQENTDIAK